MKIGFWPSKTRKASEITSEQFPLDRMPRAANTLVLTAKGAGVNPAYEAVAAGITIATGTYTGNEGSGRQIAVGFKCSMVVVFNSQYTFASGIAIPNQSHGGKDSSYWDVTTTKLSLHAADGFVVTLGDPYFNHSGDVYYYWAISE